MRMGANMTDNQFDECELNRRDIRRAMWWGRTAMLVTGIVLCCIALGVLMLVTQAY